MSRGFLLSQAAHRLRIRFFTSLSFFGTHTFPCRFLSFGQRKKHQQWEKSLLALLTCHLLIFYRYSITACICHPKKPSNITLKRVQTLHYIIPISTLLSAKWNRLQRHISSAWGAMRVRVWGPFWAACPLLYQRFWRKPRSISQLTSLPLMQKLHRFGRRKNEQLFAFSLEYGIINKKRIFWSHVNPDCAAFAVWALCCDLCKLLISKTKARSEVLGNPFETYKKPNTSNLSKAMSRPCLSSIQNRILSKTV